MISFKYFDHTTRVKFGNAEMVISDAESEVRDGLKSIAEGLDEAVAEHGDEICQQIMAQDSLVDLLHRAIQVRNLRDALQERDLSTEENTILLSLQKCPVKWVQNEAKAALHEASIPLAVDNHRADLKQAPAVVVPGEGQEIVATRELKAYRAWENDARTEGRDSVRFGELLVLDALDALRANQGGAAT